MTTVIPGSPTYGTPPILHPMPDSRLDQLAAEFAALAPHVAEVSARLEEIRTAIKAEMATAAPGQPEVLLRSSHLANVLQLKAVTSTRLDSTALKKADPATWDRWAKPSTSWRLFELKAG